MDSARLSIVFFLIFTGKAGKRMKKRWIAHPPQKARAGQTTGSCFLGRSCIEKVWHPTTELVSDEEERSLCAFDVLRSLCGFIIRHRAGAVNDFRGLPARFYSLYKMKNFN
jgi:hypothetical protein